MGISIFLTFLYIFAFPIGGLPYFDSSMIALLLLVVIFAFDERMRRAVFKIIQSEYVLTIACLWLVLCLYSAFIPILHKTYDFSIIKTFIHQALSLFIGGFLVAFFKVNKIKITDAIVLAFVAQSVLQILSMLIPQFKEITNVFRSENTILIQQRYGGIRGLAISGYAVFGLAVAYGFMFIMWSFEWKTTLVNVNVFFKLVMVSVLVVGTMSAGRTGLIGFAVGAIIRVYRLFCGEKFGIDSSLLVIMFFCTMGVIALSAIVNGVSGKIENLLNYVNEFFDNFINGKGFTSSSTDKLWEMYFKISPQTFITGDGLYTNPDGTYYMDSDAGYMRNLLFFGIFGFILLLVYQIAFFAKYRPAYRGRRIVYFLFVLIMHVKGEVLGFLIITQSMFFLFHYVYSEESERAKNIMPYGKL